MRSRRVSVLAALVAVAATMVLAGCGGDDGGGDGGEATSQQGSFSTVRSGVLTVGSDIPFPPFEFRRGEELTGFDIELSRELARRLRLRARFVDTPFDTIFTQLAAGQFDMVASATTITEERRRQVNFTEPYFAAQQALVVNIRETPELNALDGLESGDVVAVQTGTTGETYARENVPEGVDVRSFPEAPNTYTALESGAVTAVLFDEPSAVTEVAEREGLKIVQTIDTGERYGFAVDPRNEELLTALNRALAEIKQDGTYQRIYEKFEELPRGGNILEAP